MSRPSMGRETPLGVQRLAEIAAGSRPDPAEARRLAEDPDARRRLAEIEPTAVFALLGSLPPSAGVPAYRSVAPVGARGWRRAALAAAAAAVVIAALWGVSGPAPPPPQLAAARVEPVVRRIDSATAQVITIVPSSAQGPTLTLIVDEELDL